jgi:hypothetical protein
VGNKKAHFQGILGVEDYSLKPVGRKDRAYLEKSL